MKKQYALIGLLTIVLGSTINVSAAQTTTNFSNNKNKIKKIHKYYIIYRRSEFFYVQF